MHELAIADAVLSMALEQAVGRRRAHRHACVGHLRQIVPSALHFGFELVARETRAEGATLEIEHVPVAVWCDRCGEESGAAALPLLCARCGNMDVAVRRGDELLVEWIETEEP